MAERPRTPPPDPRVPGSDLTPMIDVVFQLVIFLMLANDLTRREIEDLSLPEARTATPDRDERDRVVVNLLPAPLGAPPRVRLRGESLDLDGLEAHLRARAAGRGPGREGSVLLRADRTCRWRDVQSVMQACARAGGGLRRIQFAATGPDGAGEGR